MSIPFREKFAMTQHSIFGAARGDDWNGMVCYGCVPS